MLIDTRFLIYIFSYKKSYKGMQKSVLSNYKMKALFL
jgi:hypothetical protein